MINWYYLEPGDVKHFKTEIQKWIFEINNQIIFGYKSDIKKKNESVVGMKELGNSNWATAPSHWTCLQANGHSEKGASKEGVEMAHFHG